MTRVALASLAAMLLVAAAAGAATVAPPKGPVAISLPGDAGFAFKPGPGIAAAQANCLTCHSSAYVSTQPMLSRAQWTAEVLKMRSAYGAQIADDQVPAIVEYLTTQYGKP
ncbi:MAG TPA: hypothetical protein VHT05_13920 [Candidatus Elarobacter sp.]|jgi:mono/diheme cytochrome c family protein|nr:hypothetical protein [Candidatus Elarobacter sp.]